MSAPPVAWKEMSSSSDKEGLDVRLGSLIAGSSRPVPSTQMTVSAPTGEGITLSPAVVVTFADDVVGDVPPSHAGETAPPADDGKTMPEFSAVGDRNLSGAGFVVEVPVETSVTDHFPSIGTLFGGVGEGSKQKRGLLYGSW